MHVHEFQAKWRVANLTERAAYTAHFSDLCALLGQPTPSEVDPSGERYAFEKRVTKLDGGTGFADVWRRGYFAWEYKGRGANLDAAYRQLNDYREALENPPLLVVCDLDRIQIHTNFTGTRPVVHELNLETLDLPENLAVLRRTFTEPAALRPGAQDEDVTRTAAEKFGAIAGALRLRGAEPHATAHYLVQLLFCLFAEDVGLLPKGLFARVLDAGSRDPMAFTRLADELLRAMRDGGYFGADPIPRFNGGLFNEVAVIPLLPSEIAVLREAAGLNWSRIEPAIFGTLFERSLDPNTRASLGAHYTGRHDIERVVDPVLMAPLRRRWDAVRAEAETIRAAWQAADPRSRAAANRRADLMGLLGRFQDELAGVRVLDPACGSGNFLYVALRRLLNLELEVSHYAANNGLSALFSQVHPRQMLGLEVNAYAAELASVVIWIGYLQWLAENAMLGQRTGAILESLDTIRLQDALLDRTDPNHPREAQWPAADVIIGNPPFLGGNKVRQELGDAYVEDLFAVYDGRVPAFADLVCYFFEKARAQIAAEQTERVGLLATNSIRGGVNRRVLERIKDSGDIFMAWDDEPWVIDGAAVRIAIVGFDDGSEKNRVLDGVEVTTINADLTGTVDITSAARLQENLGICFMGPSAKAPFDISADIAHRMLSAPLNPNRRPNSDVVRPVASAVDLVRRSRGMWTIDFYPRGMDEAALYELPFEYVREHVYPIRASSRRDDFGGEWWRYARPRPEMRAALTGLSRFVATPGVAKHRVFVWMPPEVLCNQGTLVFARDDDYFFGVLHSRAHEVWSLRMGTWLGVGNDPRYTPTTCFETFPFPRPDEAARAAIGEAARRLDELRRGWLNPPDASEAELKKRTLTNLYNARPTWLANAHAALDRAVWAAYGWPEPPDATHDETILARLLALNLERAAARSRLSGGVLQDGVKVPEET